MKHAKRPTALVTGAARGIGHGCAMALARRGFNVVVNGLEGVDDLSKTVAELKTLGVDAAELPGDIAEVAQHDNLIESAWQVFGGIDCLVNNAGVSVAKRGDLLDITPESFDHLIQVNLRGTFFLTQTLAKRMLEASTEAFRSIITVSSANSEAASLNRGEYCIAKSGLTMMNQLFALRLAEAGIHTYEVRPGVINTDMTAVARQHYDELFSQGLAPINRWGTTDDLGESVANLANGALPYTTGEALHVDGGLLIPRF